MAPGGRSRNGLRHECVGIGPWRYAEPFYIPWLIAVAAVAVQGLIRLQGRFQIIVAWSWWESPSLVLEMRWRSGANRTKRLDSGRDGERRCTGGMSLYLANFDVERESQSHDCSLWADVAVSKVLGRFVAGLRVDLAEALASTEFAAAVDLLA